LVNDESDTEEQCCSEILPFLSIFHVELCIAAHVAQRTTLPLSFKMAPVQPTTLPKPASTSGAAISNFRLGENDLSDASDSDQSGHSERSLSPSGAKKSKAKKRKERKQVGALTDELGTLLGAAFQTPNADTVQPNASSGMSAICNAKNCTLS
jgi:hypothetical protein